MELMSFTLGVLSIIIAAFVAVLVWGIVKVVKQQKQISSFEREIEHVHRYMNESSSNMHNRLSEMDRDAFQRLQNYERELDQRLERSQRDIDTRFNDVYQLVDHMSNNHATVVNDQITDSVTQCKSYTDSRIDKLIDTYFEMVGSKKQVIKG